MKPLPVLSTLLVSLLASAAHAGAVYVLAERDTAGKEKSTVTLSAQDKRLRVEQVVAGATAPEGVMLYKDDVVTLLHPGQRKYAVLDREAMGKIASAASQARKQMEERMAGLTPEQKAAMAGVLDQYMPGGKGQKPATVDVRDTGKKETVGEYSCRLWEASVEGKVRWQHCVVDFDRIAGSQEMLAAMEAMMGMMKEFAKASDSTWLLEQGVSVGWEELGRMKGFPVLTRIFKDGQPQMETVLKSTRTAALDAATFEPPAGYTRQTMGAL